MGNLDQHYMDIAIFENNYYMFFTAFDNPSLVCAWFFWRWIFFVDDEALVLIVFCTLTLGLASCASWVAGVLRALCAASTSFLLMVPRGSTTLSRYAFPGSAAWGEIVASGWSCIKWLEGTGGFLQSTLDYATWMSWLFWGKAFLGVHSNVVEWPMEQKQFVQVNLFECYT